MEIVVILLIIGIVFGLIGLLTESTWMTGTGIVIAILFVCAMIGYCSGIAFPEWGAEPGKNYFVISWGE